MLKWLVAAMGVLLILAGGYTAAEGWSIVQVERGWAQVIAGSALLAGGFVVLALAGVMARIDALSRSLNAPRLARPALVSPPKAAVRPESEVADSPEASESQPVPLPVEASLPLPAVLDEPKPAVPDKPVGETPPLRPASDMIPDIRVDEPPPRTVAEKPFRPIPPLPPLKSRIPRPFQKPAPEPVEEPSAPDHRPPPRVTDFRRGEWPDFPEILRPARPPAPEPVVEEDAAPEFAPPPPVLVRRYESGGVAYQLFSDGSIEAQTESGMYKFASLEELRAFIESKKL